MTPESKQALEIAVESAGSQVALCRIIDRPQSSFWTWSKGNGPAPAVIGQLVGITKGKCTADEFRRDIFGFLDPINSYLAGAMPDDARLAGIDLTWHQIEPREAVHFLMDVRQWSRKRAREAVDFLVDHDYMVGDVAA